MSFFAPESMSFILSNHLAPLFASYGLLVAVS